MKSCCRCDEYSTVSAFTMVSDDDRGKYPEWELTIDLCIPCKSIAAHRVEISKYIRIV